MIRLLIVEDENIERNYLVSSLRSMETGIDEVLEAGNGQAGLHVFEQTHPDIVIADIVMPVMNGLDMLCRIKETAPDTVCLVLSSYNSFDYARQALRMGIEDFLAKPCSKAELQAAMIKAVNLAKERASEKEQSKQMLSRFIGYRSRIEDDLVQDVLHQLRSGSTQDAMKLLGIAPNSSVLAYSLSKEPQEALRKALQSLGLILVPGTLDDQPVALLFEAGEQNLKKQDVDQIIKSIDPNARCIASGDTARISELFSKPAPVQGPLEKAAGEFHQLAGQQAKWPDAYEHLFPLFMQEDALELLESFADLLTRLSRDGKSDPIEFDFIHDLSPEHFDPSRHSVFILRELNLQLEDALRRRKLAAKSNALARTFAYIDESFRKPISLQSISAQLNISPYYLSRILNRETGESFTDLVNRCRIEEAKRLIRQGKSIKEASWNAGFAYQNYFSKVFKKLVDLSPREYRSLFR